MSTGSKKRLAKKLIFATGQNYSASYSKTHNGSSLKQMKRKETNPNPNLDYNVLNQS